MRIFVTAPLEGEHCTSSAYRKIINVKIKLPFIHKAETPSSDGYSKELEELQAALREVVALHAEEKSTGVRSDKEMVGASREKQVQLLESVAALAARAASVARNDSGQDVVAGGMQMYYNENVQPRDPVEQGYKFFKITFKKEPNAELVAETHREGQLNMGIYPVEEDYKTFKAVFTRLDGLPMGGKSSWIAGLLHADPESWEWDIAERMRRTCGRAKLDSTKFHKIYRRGNTIFIGVKPTGK